MMKIIRQSLPLVIFILIIVLLWRGLQLHPNELPSPLINRSVPTYTLPTLANTVSRSPHDFLGKITLVNVWATWCYTCAEEHPLLMKLANRPDFVLYGYLYKDNPKAGEQWLKENGNPFATVVVDQTGKTAIDWGIYGTPETFVIDQKGKVRYKLVGVITEDNWREILWPLIKSLQR